MKRTIMYKIFWKKERESYIILKGDLKKKFCSIDKNDNWGS